jgi:CHAD domain-containing protein/bifunctional DNA-binding transcriptional regulator/antitoxin component of YhaV-PrlF toxin-antitoxin module
MKIISITRSLDDMGRIIFPKEARKTMDLEETFFLKIDKEYHKVGLFKKEDGGKRRKAKLDASSRLTIPPDYLQQLNWETGTEIGLYLEGEKGFLQETAPSCAVCGSNHTLLKVKKTLVCEDCVWKGNEAIVERWAEVLQSLFQKYNEYCENAVTFEHTEDVHKARTKGRRLRTLLNFIGVPKDHNMYKRLKKAHDALGKVREEDVFIEEFENEAETSPYADVYQEFVCSANQKREKQREKLLKKLPSIIDHEFTSKFRTFLKDDIKNYILTLDLPSELRKQEDDYKKRVKNYHQAVEDKGKASSNSIECLHEVRKKAKKLRYIYSYLDKLYSQNYKSKSKPYKKIQKKFGDIIDLRDWLDEMEELKADSNEEDIDELKRQLQQRQKQLLQKVNL